MDWNIRSCGIIKCKKELNITANVWNQTGIIDTFGNISIVCNGFFLNQNSKLLFGQECKIESKCVEIAGIIDDTFNLMI